MEKVNKISGDQIKEVKEILANKAVTQLEQGEDFTELAYTKVEFGYIYSREAGYESLFKVITDQKTVFFAAQKGSLMRLQDAFTEEQFQGTVEQMKLFHGSWL
ncbi:hypothetical protein SAMN05443633_104352 [Chryseobacterium arachidis]|uniref:Uncharacterized protein n=1 Tax=Chryseobacterium arachidis TaxID=1416778 RepID=A0A1M5C030_9FLAO|nr:hypothetical protein [Chryseobacterium arachidis]SHF48026.1 hypothetical protein SAMN05443633_104352 [Chryseobacterium arachidis]